MESIRDCEGNIIRRSRNLAGIRRFVGGRHAPIIRRMAIDRLADGEGKLSIIFEGGASFKTSFACYTVLKDFVRRWRNVHGAPILVNGVDAGIASSTNPALAD